MKCHWHASSNKRHCPTAPNAVPASTNDSQDDSSSHMKRHVQCVDDPSMIGEWNRPSAIRLATKVTFRGRREFSLEKYNIRRPGYDSKLPLPRKMTLQPHQILHLPCKDSDIGRFLLLDASVTWRFYYSVMTNLLRDNSILCSATSFVHRKFLL